MLRRSLLLLAALITAPLAAQRPAPSTPAQLGFAPDRLARIDRVLGEYVDSGRIAGAVVLVMRHGKVAHLHAAGMSDREAGRPMTGDALFRLASMSKPVTSVAVMMLVEEGMIALSDPVSRWIPGFADARVASRSDSGRILTPVRRPITIRDLLTHSAGISYGTDSLVQQEYRAAGLGPAAGYGWYFADKPEGTCATIDRLAALPIVAQPGERFVYGYNTDILGCVVERASGIPFADFLERRIFAPLGMKETRFFIPPKDSLRLTTVYTRTPEGTLARADTGGRGQGAYLYGPRMNASGGAGLVGTVRDYARFAQMLLNGGTLEGNRLLGPRTVRLMTTDQLGAIYNSDSRGFGLGFEIQERPNEVGQYGSPGMYGWSGAYSTTFWIDPEEELVGVLLVQVLPRGRLDIAERFKTLVYQALVDRR
jgi:CubicO group peptidase (beta-lactamase class C family)